VRQGPRTQTRASVQSAVVLKRNPEASQNSLDRQPAGERILSFSVNNVLPFLGIGPAGKNVPRRIAMIDLPGMVGGVEKGILEKHFCLHV
jgi:hypothetical protein